MQIYFTISGGRGVVLIIVIAHRNLIVEQLCRILQVIVAEFCKAQIASEIIRKAADVDFAVCTFGCGIDIRAHSYPHNRVNASGSPVDNCVYLVLAADKLADKIIPVSCTARKSAQIKAVLWETLYKLYSVKQIPLDLVREL